MNTKIDADPPDETAPRVTPSTLEMIGDPEIAVCRGDECSMPDKDASSDTDSTR
jgi:hypothetical protein